MLPSARHARILNLLRADTVVDLKTLTSLLRVSESTIRRDLELLEKQRVLRRVHGGAVLETSAEAAGSRVVAAEPPFEVREVSHREQKECIGRLAGEWIEDGDVVFLDGGTTTQLIVPYLRERRGLTVVTCGLNIVAELAQLPQIATIVTGGELHAESRSFTGVVALGALETYIRCDKAVIACGGVSARFGITNRILERIALKRKAMDVSRQIAVIADGSKIGVATLGHVAPIEAFHVLFTDETAPAAELREIAALGVEVRTATLND